MKATRPRFQPWLLGAAAWLAALSSAAQSAPALRATRPTATRPTGAQPTTQPAAAPLPHAPLPPPKSELHFTLVDALGALRQGHPLLAMARANTRAASADAHDTRLWTNPTLSANWAYGVTNSSYDRVGAWTWQVSQFLELSGAPAERGRSSDYLTSAAQRDYDYVFFQLSCDVEAALVDWVAAERRAFNARTARDLLGAAARIILDRVAAGAAPKYDGDRIRLALAQIQADVDEADAARARARGQFAAAVGPGAEELRGEPAYELDGPRALPSSVEAQRLLETRPDVQAAELRAASARSSISVAKRSVFPGVNLQLGAGLGQAPGQLDVVLGVAAPLPILDRGQASVRAAEARKEASESYARSIVELEARRLDGLLEEAARRRGAQTQFERSAILSGDEMLREAQAGYLAGTFSVLELVDAYTTWRDAHERNVDLLAAARRSEIEVRRILGPAAGEGRP
ncbi:MAG TPA: TolC family protein [Polyangiaceae bacterium]|nr:TolC family protein [Polyangiaceae bacterium]